MTWRQRRHATGCASIRGCRGLAPAAHERADVVEQAPRLRRQFVERAAEHLRREFVRERDVVERGLDVFDHAAAHFVTAAGALVLVKKRNRVDQRQVLFMVPAVPACAPTGT